jgi:predicted DNA binding protein
MRAAEIRLSPADGAFPGVDSALSGAPGVERESIRNLEWFPDGSYALLYRLSGDPAAAEAVLADHAEVFDHEVVAADGGVDAFAHVAERETLSELLAIVEDHALLLDRPFPVTEAGVAVTVAGRSESLRAAYGELTGWIPLSVEWTGTYDPGAVGVLSRLTDRQREAIETAHELGFYESPRGVTHEGIADELGCAPSTANELLRRAEAAVLEGLLAGESFHSR